MEFKDLEHGRQVTLAPGEYHATREDEVITTLLGSCVSACLYDPVNNIIGMNHFLLAHQRYARNIPLSKTEAGRYGIHSMELLLNRMLLIGAKKNYLRAKAFGGGAVVDMGQSEDNFQCVGEVNIRFIHEFLDSERIPLIASDLGGNTGRIIHFFLNDFSVYCKPIQRSKVKKLIVRDKKYWKESIQEHEAAKLEVDLW